MAARGTEPLARGVSEPEMRLESHIFYLFTQIFGSRNRHLGEKLRPLRVTVPQWRILAVLNERPDCTMNQLADLTAVDRTTLTRALDRMVVSGLVERRNDLNDRRTVRLRLTATGAATFARVLPRVLEQNERAVRGFSVAELGQFRTLLHRMVRNLDPDYDQRNAVWLTAASRATIDTRRNKGEAS